MYVVVCEEVYLVLGSVFVVRIVVIRIVVVNIIVLMCSIFMNCWLVFVVLVVFGCLSVVRRLGILKKWLCLLSVVVVNMNVSFRSNSFL